MTETPAEYIALEPGFTKPAIGDIVAVEAVDWGMVSAQTTKDDAGHRMVRGTGYGQVIICDDHQLTIAHEVFDDDTVRHTLTIPWVCVQQVTILLGADDQ